MFVPPHDRAFEAHASAGEGALCSMMLLASMDFTWTTLCFEQSVDIKELLVPGLGKGPFSMFHHLLKKTRGHFLG